MGIIALPLKEDYFQTDNSFWTLHPPYTSMTWTRSRYIWSNIHLADKATGLDVNAPDIDFVEGEDDSEDVDANAANASNAVKDCKAEVEVDRRWHKKAAVCIAHFNVVAQCLCACHGFCLSIDDMMKLFKGQSGETYHMKTKPIKERYKFLSLCCAVTD